jgi:hypothetical protein
MVVSPGFIIWKNLPDQQIFYVADIVLAPVIYRCKKIRFAGFSKSILAFLPDIDRKHYELSLCRIEVTNIFTRKITQRIKVGTEKLFVLTFNLFRRLVPNVELSLFDCEVGRNTERFQPEIYK